MPQHRDLPVRIHRQLRVVRHTEHVHWVGRPLPEHPKRPITGFACQRSEVSGSRVWGWARARFGTPQRFFERFFITSYCPLVFMEQSGRNRTPDKLPAAERRELFAICDRALLDLTRCLTPRWVVGIGAFAEGRAREVLGEESRANIGRILHPSPASPVANRGWAERAEAQLAHLGIEV